MLWFSSMSPVIDQTCKIRMYVSHRRIRVDVFHNSEISDSDFHMMKQWLQYAPKFIYRLMKDQFTPR